MYLITFIGLRYIVPILYWMYIFGLNECELLLSCTALRYIR
jgi:hypothetical protein